MYQHNYIHVSAYALTKSMWSLKISLSCFLGDKIDLSSFASYIWLFCTYLTFTYSSNPIHLSNSIFILYFHSTEQIMIILLIIYSTLHTELDGQNVIIRSSILNTKLQYIWFHRITRLKEASIKWSCFQLTWFFKAYDMLV